MSSWQEFWNKENSIDVSARHTAVHYATIGKGVLSLLSQTRPLTLLDYGCGEALATPLFLEQSLTVELFDPVPRFEKKLRARFGETRGVRVFSTPDILRHTPHCVDVILVYSVLQYLSRTDFETLLSRFQALLKQGGKLILGDVIPPSHPMLLDTLDLMRAGLKHGFFFASLAGMVAMFFSDYRLVRAENGFTTYSEEELRALLKTHGFTMERLPQNLGLSRHRWCIVGTKQ